MKKIPLFWSVLLALSFFHPVRASEVADKIAAVVGDDVITLSEVKNYSPKKGLIARLTGQEKTGDPLESLIHEKILKVEIEKLAIGVSDEDIASSLQEVMARNKTNLEGLKADLSRRGVSFEEYKKNLSEQVRWMKFLGQVIYPRIKIADEEVSAKAGSKAGDEARFHARMEMLQARAPEELTKYLDEARAKTYVDVKR